MRAILFPLLLLAAGELRAQSETIPAFPELPQKYRAQAMKPFGYSSPLTIVNPDARIRIGKIASLKTSTGKDYIILGQDFMPCITPDMQHYRMPDGRDTAAIPAKPAAPIPNPAKPAGTAPVQ
ncbi:MAG: hypothetical protein EOO09_09980 [Chitinophagaceae bacterium]|nr:MAG: hypothetical protein EOO09_09980 [Chitinophagaceae bacterium]